MITTKVSPGVSGKAMLNSFSWAMFRYAADLLSVGGIRRSCCSHSQQLNWGGGVTENI